MIIVERNLWGGFNHFLAASISRLIKVITKEKNHCLNYIAPCQPTHPSQILSRNEMTATWEYGNIDKGMRVNSPDGIKKSLLKRGQQI
jgi:hypothetical protein